MGHLYSFCILTILTLVGSSVKVQYHGDQVLKITPQTSNHVEFLQDICNQLHLDLWKPDITAAILPGKEVHVHVPFSLLQNVKESFLQNNISYEVMIPDVQKVIQHQTMAAPENQKRSLNNFDYTKYHPMHEIYDWMTQIREEYDDIVTLHHLGTTYEQRPIFYFKIGWPSDQKKKIIWMDCGIHAREWISVAFCQWFIREILENQHSNPVLNKALRNIDFYIVPVLNIDGFIYSWTTDRLWRKSRSSHKNGTCYGVDLNRNFDAQWCSIGASENCSTLTYCGTGPNSEPESAAVADLVGSLKSEILCFLTIHSYSQLILLPYGYTKDPSKNHDEMLTVAEKAAAKLQQRHGTTYQVGSSAHILYSSSGSSRDWAADLGINFVYTFELRDNGTYGFELPENQIKPTCEETTDAVLTIVDYLNEKYFNSANSLLSTNLWINLCLPFIIAIYY
ncbi:carboxypeptidase O-like [Pelobates fuscus]|uniref:carboxypeptidase O-like n=1 Tax=Pelobates fuscus TaxID=191477 RepID=UPI002FE4D284